MPPTPRCRCPTGSGSTRSSSALWDDNGPFARSCLLRDHRHGCRSRYGPWRALKRIFKEAEARDDTEVFGALAARFDMAHASGDPHESARDARLPPPPGLAYLRRTGAACPACYADAAADVLAHYTDATRLAAAPGSPTTSSYHETGEYDRVQFPPPAGTPSDLLKDRAFADLWRRSPRPLFGLLERAGSDQVRQFAAEALKADFRALAPRGRAGWVARLVERGQRAGRRVRRLGPDQRPAVRAGRVPLARPARGRAPAVRLAVVAGPGLRRRVCPDPRPRPAGRRAGPPGRQHKRGRPHGWRSTCSRAATRARRSAWRPGAGSWRRSTATTLAAAVLRKHFGAKELTPEWFGDRLFSPNASGFSSSRRCCSRSIPPRDARPRLLRGSASSGRRPPTIVDGTQRVTEFALEQLARSTSDTLDRDLLRRLLLHPLTRDQRIAWIDEGRLKAQTLGLDFLKALAFHPDWEADPWLDRVAPQRPAWARDLEFDEALSEQVLGWLRDVRRFSPADLGFEWLLRLASAAEPRYHNFAVETMIKGFTPADFAPDKRPRPAPAAAPAGRSTWAVPRSCSPARWRPCSARRPRTRSGTWAGRWPRG